MINPALVIARLLRIAVVAAGLLVVWGSVYARVFHKVLIDALYNIHVSTMN